ncbi:acyl carrier protein [Kitasatospora sp. NPDC092948]|uniref:acyl carrier protein n=1 Tax=Kitasatospora sp. NPDC092948 TaxID=3364088 RepID=UPI003826C837
MSVLDLPALTRILRENAGADESVDLSGDILDTPFPDLGYDSLALLQAIGVIQRDFGVQLDDDAAAAETPREFLALVNGAELPSAELV